MAKTSENRGKPDWLRISHILTVNSDFQLSVFLTPERNPNLAFTSIRYLETSFSVSEYLTISRSHSLLKKPTAPCIILVLLVESTY